MSNFDFLKGFNNELYEIGVKLEDDVLNSPRAVTADATLFLEALVTDIYLRSNIKMENDHISFYKKIDNIYRKGVISYIYKNKLREAYSLRNKIHKNCNDGEEEIKLAFDLHKRLYFIAKKYFRDFTDDERHVKIPDYKKPQNRDINFDNCIICGCENRDLPSNMCGECNRKVDNANLLLGIQNSFKDSRFTKNDLIEYGLSESETNSFLIFLSKENIVMKKGGLYHINEEEFNKYLDEVNEYIEIGLLITQFYRDEISAGEIKATLEYWKGGIKQKPFAEFYRLVNIKLERSFEEALLKSENIKMSIKKSFMDELTIKEWFNSKKKDFMEGDLDESFILFNELLIKDYFKLKKKNVGDGEIKNKLHLSDDIIDFWQNDFMSSEFLTKTTDIKKELIIKEIRKNKTLREALMSVGISQNEFNKIYYRSKNENDQFYKIFDKEYTQKRQKRFLRHLKINNLNKAIRISKITKDEFYRWYYSGEVEYSEFYVKTTKLLMNQYLKYRRRGWNKQEILKKMNISKEMVKSWTKHKDLDMVAEFEHENAKITSNFVKRGKIINALKDDKSKSEAIQSAQLTQEEFLNLYNTSKNEKSDFHIRFDEEYAANRKRLFPKLLVKHDFYNSIQKCEITQKQFNSWYFKDQDRFIETGDGTDFYIETTQLLMIKYIKSRRMGKNKPDSARSVGLSNIIVDKWLRHPEFEMYWNFKKENDKLEKDLITEGFKDMKSKRDVSEYYDISPKTIDEFINLGKSGFVEFQEIFELYEDYVIPNLLKDFMNNLKNKPYNKALKASKITEEELEYYSRLGKSGNEKFSKFYNEYLKIKINLYVNTILSKKSKKIALKNSCLSKEEFRENEKDISQRILDGRFDIIAGEIERQKSTGTKLAKKAGITVNEIYDWYIKGKSGDEKFEDFASIFELSVILPRVMAVRHAKSVGVPKNWLHKKLKKELGSEEYKIWDKHGFIDDEEINHLNLGEIDEERIRKSLQNFEYIRTVCNEDDDAFQFMKKAVKSNAKYSKVPIHLSKQKEENLSKSEIVGK